MVKTSSPKHNSKPDPDLVVQENKLYDGNDMGVLCKDNSQGVIIRNEIFGNLKSGIKVRNG